MVRTKKNKIKGGALDTVLYPHITTLINPHTIATHIPTLYPKEKINSMQELNDNDYFKTSLKMLEDLIKDIQKSFLENKKFKSYRETKDYKKYSLIPGQQIAYGGAFGFQQLKHYGIYLGNGLVYELAPQSENKSKRYGPEISVGLSNIENFASLSIGKKSHIYVFDYKKIETDNKKTIKDRLERVRKFTKKYRLRNKQLLVYGNCESVSNYISYGKYRTSQGESILTAISSISILLYKGGKYIIKKLNEEEDIVSIDCKKYNSTVFDCPCDSEPKKFLNPISNNFGKKYCYIDKFTCKNKSLHEKEGIKYWGNLKRDKVSYKLKSKLKKKNKKVKSYWKKC